MSKSVWDKFTEYYNLGTKPKKGQKPLINFLDTQNLLKPELARFSAGHLWHGAQSSESGIHFGLEENRIAFKDLFKVGERLGDNKLISDILGKGKKLIDLEGYNKSHPGEWGKNSQSNLMSFYEHDGKKYAHFVGHGEKNKGENILYELAGANENFAASVKNWRESQGGSEGMPNDTRETSRKPKNTWELGDVEEFFKQKGYSKRKARSLAEDSEVRKTHGIKLSAKATDELFLRGESKKKKEKGLKAGFAISSDFADTLKRAWENSYRG